jgi:hypothetical protein
VLLAAVSVPTRASGQKEGMPGLAHVRQEGGPRGIVLAGKGRRPGIIRPAHVPPIWRDAPDQPQPDCGLQQRWPAAGARRVKSRVLILFGGTALAERIRAGSVFPTATHSHTYSKRSLSQLVCLPRLGAAGPCLPWAEDLRLAYAPVW